MRSVILFIAVSLITVSVGPLSFLVPTVIAQPPPTRLGVTIGVDPDGKLAFVPNVILIPQVNVTLNVTFINNYTEGGGTIHTFTLRNAGGDIVVNTDDVPAGGNASVEFQISSLTNISYNGRSFEPQPLGRGIRFFCIPHEQVPMEGAILLASLTEEPTEKGLLLRAYWIGLIGLFAMILWIGISYFVIKSSSPRFTDHKGHLKKGLP